ncbi:MAG: hypothetical protein ACOX1S_10490 [Anaerostipes sp.]|jgi:hypothetical protein
MGLFGKGNVMNMNHYEGIPTFGNRWAITMELTDDYLIFKPRAFKNVQPVQLPLTKITHAGNINTTEIVEQSKLGRAAIGGFLFGGAGAIVGAMSAGEKEKIKTLYIINYISDDEEKVIIMQSNGNPNYFKFQKKLQELLPKQEIQQGTITL